MDWLDNQADRDDGNVQIHPYQMVHHLAKARVEGWSPVVRSGEPLA